MRPSFNFDIGLEDIYSDQTLKDRSIMLYLENTASFHSDMVGQGLKNIMETHLAWAVLDWKIEIIKRPTYGQKITVETWSKGYTKVVAYRDYHLYADGELCVKASSRWFQIDLDRRMPARLKEENLVKYGSEDISAIPVESLDKFTVPEEYDREITYTIRKSDIDTSGHVHNLNYLNMALEAFEDKDGEMSIPRFKEIRINYQKEITYGATVRVRLLSKDNLHYVKILSQDEASVHALLILSE